MDNLVALCVCASHVCRVMLLMCCNYGNAVHALHTQCGLWLPEHRFTVLLPTLMSVLIHFLTMPLFVCYHDFLQLYIFKITNEKRLQV